MRIAYVVGEFPSLTETFIAREIAALRRAGMDMTILALSRAPAARVHASSVALMDAVVYPPPTLSRRHARAHLRLALRSPARYARMWSRVFSQARYGARACAGALRRIPAAVSFAGELARRRVSHVHAQFAFAPADVAAAVAGLLGITHSVSVHARDVYTQDARTLAGRLAGASFVTACTREGQGIVQALRGIDAGRVHLVRHGLPLEEFPFARRGGDLVAAVGRLEPKKGFIHLVDACAILRQRGVAFRCVIAGDGGERERIAGRVRGCGLEDRVLLAGAMDESEVRSLLAGAAVLAVPSVTDHAGDRDGVPNVLLEAMALGVPAAVSAMPAIREVVEDGVSGLLFAPGAAGKLAERIEELLRGAERAYALAVRARRIIEAEFDVSVNVRELGRLFQAAG